MLRKFLYNNSLSIVFLSLFLLAIVGQYCAGLLEYNEERMEHGQASIPAWSYVTSGHFLQATFENWESEFLQMALFVALTISLRQKGSSESKKCEGKEEVDREPDRKKRNAPWAVKQGGWVLAIYKHSLTIALLLLFFLSFALHLYGSLKNENEELLQQEMPAESWSHYFGDSRFWFESLQNWQSEFLSVFAIVILSVYLRQKGSPQSKPVDAPHAETGE